MGDVLAKIRDMPRTDLFPVTLLAIAFHVALMRPVRECDAIFELEYRRAIICKSCRRHEEYYRD